jgi:hypothetical protein
MNEEISVALSDLDNALAKIRNTKSGKATAGVEAIYGMAYQRLVRLGARPQLKGKYRG